MCSPRTKMQEGHEVRGPSVLKMSDDDGWEVIGDSAPWLKNPPPRSIKLKIVYEALLEGRIEWGSEW
jgi:hypothetical protein